MKDEIVSQGPWEFGAAVADCFDDMLGRSIPDLPQLRRIIAELADTALGTQPAVIVDHGCSLGGTLLAVEGPQRRLFGFDSSPDMVAKARSRLKERAEIAELDITETSAMHPPADLTCFIFTLQFIEPSARAGVLARAFAAAAPGSLLLVAEKTTADVERTQAVLTQAYHRRKQQAGYTWEQIHAKAASLEGVMVPLSARSTEELIVGAGWTAPESVWRSLSFTAWASWKPPSTPGGHILGTFWAHPA